MKIIIEGAYGEKNFGDDALLKVLHTHLTKEIKSSEIIVKTKKEPYHYDMSFCSGDSVVTSDYNDLPTEINKVIFGGGTQFYSFYNESDNRIKDYVNRALTYFKRKKIAKIKGDFLRRCQKYYVGIGLGPFENKGSLHKIYSVLKDSKILYLRDNQSLSYAKELNISQAKLCVDLCYADNIKFVRRNNIKKIAVILRDWPHNNKHFNVREILDNIPSNFDVNFVFFGEDKKTKKECQDNNIDYISYNPDEKSFDNFVKELSTYDLFVTSRFHGVVYGQMLGIPSVVLNIEPKLEIAFRELGGYALVESDELNMLSMLESESSHYNQIVSSIFETVKVNRTKANAMLDELLESLNND